MFDVRPISVLLILVFFSFSSKGQIFIDQIKVGEPMPSEIRQGGYSEENSEDCNCRIFSIKHDQGRTTAETIGIHYNENDTVTGIIKIGLKVSSEAAKEMYIFHLSDFTRTIKAWKNKRELLRVRSTGKSGIVDGIYYFAYRYSDEAMIRATGLVEGAIIEEKYLPNSSYQPRLIN